MIDIFGTLGPSCDNEDILEAMFKEGMTGIRINLSHVMLADCKDSIKRIQAAAAKCGVTPKILIDMQGPELRIGDLEQPLVLNEGDEFTLELDARILAHLSQGKEILLDDGKILAKVVEPAGSAARDSAVATFTTLRGGTLTSRKSIAIPGEQAEMPALTNRDKENLKLAQEYGVTGVMQPFVRSAEDLKELRAVLDEHAGGIDSASEETAECAHTGKGTSYA